MGDPSALEVSDAVALSASLDPLMPRAMKVCSRPGCPNLTRSGRCDEHEREADRARGTAAERGYTGRGHQSFRRAVLRRDPICVLCQIRPSQHADHYPLSRRELVDQGLNPNDPKHGRGLCASCHSKETFKHQPGGFTAR